MKEKKRRKKKSKMKATKKLMKTPMILIQLVMGLIL